MKRKTLAILTAAAMAAGSLSAGVCVYAADYSLRGEGGKNEPIVHEGYLQII